MSEYQFFKGKGGKDHGYWSRTPLTENDVETTSENYVYSTRNPNLKVGKITEQDNCFEAQIPTKSDDLVDKVLVDKNTGGMMSIH